MAHRRPSRQEQNRRRIERASRTVGAETLIIPVVSMCERDRLRARVPHSGASIVRPLYVATSMIFLPIAMRELMTLRRVAMAVVRRRRGSWLLSTGDC